MPIGAWTTTSTWAPAQTVQVWPDATTGWVRAKKTKVWNGSAWVLSWVHPVTDAGLSLSKSGVATNEAYNVILTAPGGFPEGAAVTFRRTGYTSPVVYPTEGSTTATLVGATHASSGSYAWFADVVTKGGNTSFGPVTQTVAIISTTVTLTAPAWVLSASQSGAGGSATIAQAAFSITLGTPAVVSTLSLQLSYAGGAWTEYKSWASPPATVNHSITFNTTGAWRARAVVTQTDSSTVYSAEKAITCYKKSLVAAASDTTLDTNQVLTLTASHTGDAVGQTTGYWDYLLTSDGIWHNNWNASNPVTWSSPSPLDIQWRWRETYSDGSTIISNVVRTIVSQNAISTDSGSYGGVAGGTGLINAMRAARSANKPLHVYGTWNLELNEIWIPDGVTVVCQPGAKFNHTPVARFKNAAAWPATNMPNSCGGYSGGTFSWTGGEFNGGGDGIFTISHSPGFTITGATFYNYCTSSQDGHAIECNSSGGADRGGAAYTIQITNNLFRGVSGGQRANGNDEPVHYDWAWQGSGCAGAEDHSMCQNLRIAGNSFHRLSESAPWAFALCAIGGHRMSSGSYGNMGNAGIANPSNGEPSQRHNSFLIENNSIHGAVGSTAGVSPDKGAIALWNARDVIVRNNNFYGCTDSRLVSGWDATQNLNSAAVNISLSGNTHNGAGKAIAMPASNTTGG